MEFIVKKKLLENVEDVEDFSANLLFTVNYTNLYNDFLILIFNKLNVDRYKKSFFREIRFFPV